MNVDDITEKLLVEWHELPEEDEITFGGYIRNRCPLVYDAVKKEEHRIWLEEYES